jgi:hypothetical protein
MRLQEQMEENLRPHWSLDAEAMFHHISNAVMASKNDGINAFVGFIGLTYFFNPP